MSTSPEALLLDMFNAAVAAAQPKSCVPINLPEAGKGGTIVVGAGKAAAAMAKVVEDNWSGPLSGIVVTRYGHSVPCSKIEVVEAAHPVPDDAGLEAARRILQTAKKARPDDLVIALISGGASSLLTLPAQGIGLDEKQLVNRALLRSGATISEMNCVRKQLSAIKGGRLARACNGARLVTLVISDVPGDDVSIIGSGPTVPDSSTPAQAMAILEAYGIELPQSVVAHLQRENDQEIGEPIPSNGRSEVVLIATPAMALEAAGDVARRAGFEVLMLGDALEGEARDVARKHAALARDVGPGHVVLSGGELTVTLAGEGRGGPNAEYALGLAIALEGQSGVWAIACDTDGIDGSEDNAGALVKPDTMSRAGKLGLSPPAYLQRNESYGFFSALNDLVVCGPTLTNVNDFRAILIDR